MEEPQRIIRTVCWFTRLPDPAVRARLGDVVSTLSEAGYTVQTQRICCPAGSPQELLEAYPDEDVLVCMGSIGPEALDCASDRLSASPRLYANCDLTHVDISEGHASAVMELAKRCPQATFRFAFTFNNVASTPFFPSASYERDGFSIGLQPTNLAHQCRSLDEWLARMKKEWDLLLGLLDTDDFLGIDSSVAPLGSGDGSLVQTVERLGPGFERAVTTDFFLRISSFLTQANPRPVGLCGLMFPCLEDFELAKVYEEGRFPIERNLFLALHSGLGLDTYPLGLDESPTRVAEVLRLVQGLARKYRKPLSVRLVSDGHALVHERTDFQNPYLKDVKVRPL